MNRAYRLASHLPAKLFLLLFAFLIWGTSAFATEAFGNIPALSFNKTYGGADPLPQEITVTSTGAAFAFNATAAATTGGSWLSITPNYFGCCTNTPTTITVNVNPDVTLAAGTYTGQVVLKSNDNATSMTIPVTLVVHASTDTYFDQIAGGLTFTLQTNGKVPPAQVIPIRNAGSGTLNWTATTSTADGGTWLKLSTGSGTAPSALTVSIVLANLPGTGLTAGTFTGQVVLTESGEHITVPITVVVGSNVFAQVNPLEFTKAYAGLNPLSQVITVASTGTDFAFNATVLNSTGGSWLSVTPNYYGCCTNTPQGITVTVNPTVTLAAGYYAAEILVRSNVGDEALIIPVHLTIAPSASAFFDDVAGSLNFSMQTSGDAPPAQALQIRNLGTGSLVWTATTSTADGGAWLGMSAKAGTAPSNINVTITPANLPGGGLLPGTFVGQVVLITTAGRVTVPVSFVVGDAVFAQVNPLNFTKVYGGDDPLPQVISIASTGTNFAFNAVVVNSTGGNWLTITPNYFGCCTNTPQAITVTVSPTASLAAGTYAAEIVVKANTGTQSLTIPVTLTIAPASSAFFDALPGQLTFSMQTSGATPPPQAIEIRNAGAGTLSWKASASTADGGAWLKVSAASGKAPYVLAASVVPANLPGGGLLAGTFTGQVILDAPGNRVTIPVTMVVGDSIFAQVNALNFTKVVGGANPLPQFVELASTKTNFSFNVVAARGTGGAWLSISPSYYGCCTNTPQVVTAIVSPAANLAAGTYTAEIIAKANTGAQSVVIPVTLTVAPATSAFFDDLPGALSYFQATGGTAPAAQSIQIRNRGVGILNWAAVATTADGGNWLSLSRGNGTAPSNLNISVNSANLPGGGLTAGTFNGQVILQTTGDRETIPVTVVVGANVYTPVTALKFSKAFGGSNPASQTISVQSTATNFSFAGVAYSGTGGNWLGISPSSYGCCTSTPFTVTATANPVNTLAAGAYTAEILFRSNAGDMGLVIPVTLTVNSSTAASAPVFNRPTGDYWPSTTVSMSDTTQAAGIYYTTDGSTPTPASTQFNGTPVLVNKTETVKAIAAAPGFPNSAVTSVPYTIAPIPAVLTSPAPGSKLPGASVTFNWTVGLGVDAYRLYIGTTSGGSDIDAVEAGTATTTTVNNVPTNGEKLYVTLFSSISGTWRPKFYTFIASGVGTPAAITSPTPGIKLGGASASFVWSTGDGITNYTLLIGSAVGAGDIDKFASLTTTSKSVTNLPTNGETIYVTLLSLNGNTNLKNSYTYVASGTGTPAVMTSPVPGTKFTTTSATFTWSKGVGITNYTLSIGNTAGGNNIDNITTTGTSKTVTNLPANGETLYITLASLNGNTSLKRTYTYVASGVGTAAAMTLPTPGQKLGSASATFTWSKGVGITKYTLIIGSTPGGSDLDKITTTTTSQMVTNLPTNGETLYITLLSLNGNTNLKNTYLYFASGTGTAATMSTPVPGSTLTSASATFTWTAGEGITNYTLSIGTTAGANDIDNITTKSLSQGVTNLPTDGSTIYVKLSSLNGKSYLIKSYTYKATGP